LVVEEQHSLTAKRLSRNTHTRAFCPITISSLLLSNLALSSKHMGRIAKTAFHLLLKGSFSHLKSSGSPSPRRIQPLPSLIPYSILSFLPFISLLMLLWYRRGNSKVSSHETELSRSGKNHSLAFATAFPVKVLAMLSSPPCAFIAAWSVFRA